MCGAWVPWLQDVWCLGAMAAGCVVLGCARQVACTGGCRARAVAFSARGKMGGASACVFVEGGIGDDLCLSILRGRSGSGEHEQALGGPEEGKGS